MICKSPQRCSEVMREKNPPKTGLVSLKFCRIGSQRVLKAGITYDHFSSGIFGLYTWIYILPKLSVFNFWYILIQSVCSCCIFLSPLFTDHGWFTSPVDQCVTYKVPRQQSLHQQSAVEPWRSDSQMKRRCVWDSCRTGAAPSPERQAMMFTHRSAGCGEVLHEE